MIMNQCTVKKGNERLRDAQNILVYDAMQGNEVLEVLWIYSCGQHCKQMKNDYPVYNRKLLA